MSHNAGDRKSQESGVPSATTAPVPTLAEVYDRLRDEHEALGLLNYHGAPWDHGNTTWYADLTKDDIDKLRGLLRDAGAAIEGYA